MSNRVMLMLQMDRDYCSPVRTSATAFENEKKVYIMNLHKCLVKTPSPVIINSDPSLKVKSTLSQVRSA